ncbi:MAG: hypothetical protein WBA09_22455 [Candidatus Acidiferrum sp.]
MSTQASLFDNPETGRARRRDPDTSKRAARSVDATPLQRMVLSLLNQHSAGLTTHQLAEFMDIDLVTVSPRIAPLVRRGLVCDSGQRRKGESGRMSIVWKVV